MEDYYIKKFLEILNINSVNKLNDGSIDYFWQKKYKEIQTSKNISTKKKENLLIELNNARDELNEIDIESLNKLLNNDQTNYLENIENSKSEENSNKDDEIYTRNNSYDSKDEESKDNTRNTFLLILLLIIFKTIVVPIYQEWDNKVSNNSNRENINNKGSTFQKIINFSNGRYEGDFINGERTGRGTFYWNDGSRYEGDFLKGKRHGYGNYYWNNGNRYEGDFINGERTGRGTFYWNNGDRYEGDFLKGKRQGYGNYYWGEGKWEGDRYEGYWSDGKRNGYGRYTYSSGNSEEQYWNNGQLQR